MYFQLKSLVLWPRNKTFPPAVVPFHLGAMNVISGLSRTGKSAVIPIIDYCLGANHCAIPVDTIRNHCEWFGVVVATAEGEKLLARKEPGQLRVTGDMYIAEGQDVVIPREVPGKNTSVDAVKTRLDELAHLTLLDFDANETGSGFLGRPSFRDMMAFCFQPQNVIANQNVLFYGADSHIHREKLRSVFPYVLGAISAEVLAKQHRLGELRKDLARKERELQALRTVSERWVAEMWRWVSEARELGLLPGAANADSEAKPGILIELLRKVLATERRDTRVTAATLEESGRDLVALQREESAIATEAVRLRGRLHEMQALRETTDRYHDALEVRKERLQVAQWLQGLGGTDQTCPVCGQGMEAAESHLQELLDALKDIERSAGTFERVPAAFDRELERVRKEVTLTVEKLTGVRLRIKALTDGSAQAAEYREAAYRTDRFLGRLEQAVAQFEELAEDGPLVAEVERLRAEVDALAAELKQQDVARRQELALRRVANNAQQLLVGLDAEHPEDPVSLGVDDLTVRIAGRDREHALWEIGSGSNWLSYHLAMSLALQQFFLAQKENPVPSFVVYDQPSQVYFPRRLAAPRQVSEGETSVEPVYENDEDVEAVQKAFRVLTQVVRDAGGRLQVVVLDHAASTVWGQISGIHEVADWRGGRKLVPIEWIESASAQSP